MVPYDYSLRLETLESCESQDLIIPQASPPPWRDDQASSKKEKYIDKNSKF